jgi:hypothetical protein
MMSEEKATVFVVGCYHVFLNRSPEYTGLRGWVDALIKGDLTEDQVLERIKDSDEYKAKWAA